MKSQSKFFISFALVISTFICLISPYSIANGITALPEPDPKPGSYGFEATKKQPPPTTGATITTPSNGASFADNIITVNGICPDGLEVELYNNEVMVGATMCNGGSFSLQISLFPGQNELKARVFDSLNQQGPESNVVNVTYTDTHFLQFGQPITLTSIYGRKSAKVNTSLPWPLQLSGGTGPYAFSIDWGDGSKPDLMSQPLAGDIEIKHTYKKAGVYQVNILVTDVNGVSAFLQLVAVSSGEVDSTSTALSGVDAGEQSGPLRILWIPYIILLVLLLPTYWLGRRSQLVSIRNKLIKERDEYMQEAKEAVEK